jgi:thiazole synthase ThiGH ThiG subunit
MNAPLVNVPLPDAPLRVAGRDYRSRLLVGTGKYKDFAETRAAVEAGREAFLAGRMPRKLYAASPSSPATGLIA